MKKIPGLECVPERILGLLLGAIESRLLVAALKLDVFGLLNDERTVEDVSKKLGTHPGNTRLMLRGLTALGLLRCRNGSYVNSAEARTFLDPQSPACIGRWVIDSADQFEPVIRNMVDLIKAGPGKPKDDEHMNSEEMCAYYTHSHARSELAGIAQATAALIRSLPEFPRFMKMLDLGGGPGLNSVAILEDNPILKGVVFDRASVVAIAEEYIKQYGMADRIATRAGDYLRDDPGNGYDLILASDTLYYEPDLLNPLVSRLYAALNPGGVLVGIHGVVHREPPAPRMGVIGILPDALAGCGDLPDANFLAPCLLKAGFSSVHTRETHLGFGLMQVDIARKAIGRNCAADTCDRCG
jgi:predicted O-methyltransferase YrrM